MKISYFEFRARLQRGGYECTKIQLEGLYARYMRDCEPVWVSDCVNPKPIRSFSAVALPAVTEPAVECVRIKPRIVCENRILAALVEREMLANELAKLIDRCVTYVRVLMRRMVANGQIEVTARVVMIKTKNGEQNACRKYYSLAKKEQAA